MAKTRLRAVRDQLGYSSAEVIRLLQHRASTLGLAIMSPSSLKTRLSVWENGHDAVSDLYMRLFRDVYGRTNEELGFPSEPDDSELLELRSRLTLARTVDAATVALF